MKRLFICMLLLVACKASSPPPPAVTEKTVTLTTNNPGGGALILSRVSPSTAASRAATGDHRELLEASARFREKTLVVDFLSPLPANTRQVVVETAVSLLEAGAVCAIAPGKYDIANTTQLAPASAETRTTDSAVVPSHGSVRLAVATASGHRRRPSRRLSNLG